MVKKAQKASVKNTGIGSYCSNMQTAICFFLTLLMLCGCSPNHNQQNAQINIPVFISNLADDERLPLEYFFRSLIQEDSIGYVFLGGKPMGFHSYILPKPKVKFYPLSVVDELHFFFEAFANNNILFHKGFKVWKKYEKQFCGNNIVFDLFAEDEELHWMKAIVINKRLLMPLIEQHFNKFKALDPSLNSTESIFHALVCNPEFKRKFYNTDHLLGIALGYGEKNAALFQQRADILSSLGQLGFTLAMPSASHIKDLQAQCAAIESSFKGFKDHESKRFLFTLGVGFAALPSHPETTLLHNKYSHLHSQLTQAYSDSRFLEKTLELIVAEDQAPQP